MAQLASEAIGCKAFKKILWQFFPLGMTPKRIRRVAEFLGVSRATFERWLNGTVPCSNVRLGVKRSLWRWKELHSPIGNAEFVLLLRRFFPGPRQPTERELKVLSHKIGTSPELLSEWLRGKHLPFETVRPKVRRLLNEFQSGVWTF